MNVNSFMKLFCTGALIFSVGAEAQRNINVNMISTSALRDSDSNVEYKVKVKLAGRGRTGELQILQKDSSNPRNWNVLETCASSNGYRDVRSLTEPFLRTPGGRYQPIETSSNLWYQGRFLNNVRFATYFITAEASQNGRVVSRAPVAIHTGHRAGANSHGCIRTETRCAQRIYNIANSIATRAAGTSPVFTAFEGEARNKRNFQSMVIETYWPGPLNRLNRR